MSNVLVVLESEAHRYSRPNREPIFAMAANLSNEAIIQLMWDKFGAEPDGFSEEGKPRRFKNGFKKYELVEVPFEKVV